jgi:selenocysteine-specific elongation factor
VIIATAGHIDHGKTSLVHALTSVDTDRLPEERARGLTIDLGYAYSDIGEGEGGGGRIGFVDVPGHHRFIKNMVAGVTGIDAALLIVAADDGPMPQTEEHLAILDLLGVSHGVVALTKCDRVGEARRLEAEAEIRQMLAGSTLSGAPIIPTSTVTGAGLALLRTEIMGLNPDRPDLQRPFRMAIDRSFVIDGAGVILTGSILSGTIRRGDEVMIGPQGITVTVRGLRAQDSDTDVATAGQRCAVQIGGRQAGREVASRGDWLCAPNAGIASQRLDVRVRLARTQTTSVRHDLPVHVHVGAADVPGRLALLQSRRLQPGEAAWAQLILDRPVSCAHGDRFILRDHSAQSTLGGGRVIDPDGPVRGRARPERLLELEALGQPSTEAQLQGLLQLRDALIDPLDFARRMNLNPVAVEESRERLGARQVGGKLITPSRWGDWREKVLAALAEDHRDRPDRLGLEDHALARAARLRAPDLRLILQELAHAGEVVSRFGVHRLKHHAPSLAKSDEAAWHRIRPALGDADIPAEVVHQLALQQKIDPAELRALLDRAAAVGLVVRISKNRYLAPETMATLANAVDGAAAARAPESFSISDFRAHAPIGRNLAVEFLEYLDRRQLTHRDKAGRQLLRRLGNALGEEG